MNNSSLRREEAEKANCTDNIPLLDRIINDLFPSGTDRKSATDEDLNTRPDSTAHRFPLLTFGSSTGLSTCEQQLHSPTNAQKGGVASKPKIDFGSIAERFRHFLFINNLSSYLDATDALKREDAVRQVLNAKSQAEVNAFVLCLMDLLEGVYSSYFDGDRRGSNPVTAMSNASIASLMESPVYETNRVAMAVDKKGNAVINRYTIIASLGKGAYGEVKLGQAIDTGQQVAIKVVKKRHLRKRTFGRSSFDSVLRREVAIMKKVRHRHCVSLYEVIDDPESLNLYLIMEYVPNGPVVRVAERILQPATIRKAESTQASIHAKDSLNRYLVRCAIRRSCSNLSPLTEAEIESRTIVFSCTPLEETVCARYVRQLVSGLRYLHKRNVVHHDIKPDNILLGNDHNVVFSDFGVSEILGNNSISDDSQPNSSSCHSKAKLGGGTLLFTAPELLGANSDPLSVDPFQTDVWALGVTVYFMLVGCAPFMGTCYGELTKCIAEKDFPWNGRNWLNRPLLPKWKVLLDGLLAKNPQKRWSLVQLKTFLDQDLAPDLVQLGQKCIAEVAQNPMGTEMNNANVGASPLLAAPRLPDIKGNNAAAIFWSMQVTEEEMNKATRQERVPEVTWKPFNAVFAKIMVHRYVKGLRQRMQEKAMAEMRMVSDGSMRAGVQPGGLDGSLASLLTARTVVGYPGWTSPRKISVGECGAEVATSEAAPPSKDGFFSMIRHCSPAMLDNVISIVNIDTPSVSTSSISVCASVPQRSTIDTFSRKTVGSVPRDDGKVVNDFALPRLPAEKRTWLDPQARPQHRIPEPQTSSAKFEQPQCASDRPLDPATADLKRPWLAGRVVPKPLTSTEGKSASPAKNRVWFRS